MLFLSDSEELYGLKTEVKVVHWSATGLATIWSWTAWSVWEVHILYSTLLFIRSACGTLVFSYFSYSVGTL